MKMRSATTMVIASAIVGGAFLIAPPASALALSEPPRRPRGRPRGRGGASLPKPLPPSPADVRIRKALAVVGRTGARAGSPAARKPAARAGSPAAREDPIGGFVVARPIELGLVAVFAAAGLRGALIRGRERREEDERRRGEEAAREAYRRTFDIADLSPPQSLPEARELPVIDVPSAARGAAAGAARRVAAGLRGAVPPGAAAVLDEGRERADRLGRVLGEAAGALNAKQAGWLGDEGAPPAGELAGRLAGELAAGVAEVAAGLGGRLERADPRSNAAVAAGAAAASGLTLAGSAALARRRSAKTEEGEGRSARIATTRPGRGGGGGGKAKAAATPQTGRDKRADASTKSIDAIPKRTADGIAAGDGPGGRGGAEGEIRNKPVPAAKSRASDNAGRESEAIAPIATTVPPLLDVVRTKIAENTPGQKIATTPVAAVVGASLSLAILAIASRNTRDRRQTIEDDRGKEEAAEQEMENRFDGSGNGGRSATIDEVDGVGDLARSIREQIAEVEANIDAFADEDVKGLLKGQKRDLEEMLRLAVQNDL